MKHLTKFVKFLTESEEWDKEDLNDFLIPLKHIGIEVIVDSKRTALSGEYEGREITTIRIFLTNLKKFGVGNGVGMDYGTIYDERIWEILDEVCTLKRRLESDKVFIHMTTAEIKVSYLHGLVDINTLEFKLKKLKAEIDSKHRSSKSDFALGIAVKIKDNAVVVNCSMSYTRRKWNSLVKGIDFSNWNLDFKEGEGLIYENCVITITPKN
jgi:hypothetical protein